MKPGSAKVRVFLLVAVSSVVVAHSDTDAIG